MRNSGEHHGSITRCAVLLWLLFPQMLCRAIPAGQPSDLPGSLGLLKLTTRLQGKEAQSFLDNLHDKNIAPVNSLIGKYRWGKSQAFLFISIYTSDFLASAVNKKMSSLSSRGNQPFSDYSQLERRSTSISRCTGLGQTHFFFKHLNGVYWLSVDPGISDATMRALVNFLTKS